MVMVGFHGGHPPPSHRDPLEAWPCNSLQPLEPGLAGPSPTLGKRERSRGRLLKFLSREINIGAISEQVFQLWAWRLSPIPVMGTDSCLIYLCYPPRHNLESLGTFDLSTVSSPQDPGTAQYWFCPSAGL